MLLSPVRIRSLELRNRTVISPMCQYSAEDGKLTDWHLAHLGQFAMGGAGLVFTEATAVEERGRITHGDAGLWNDAQIVPFKRVFAYHFTLRAQEDGTFKTYWGRHDWVGKGADRGPCKTEQGAATHAELGPALDWIAEKIPMHAN